MANYLPSKDRMTLNEFEQFIESSDEKWEFIDGKPVLLSQPHSLHYAISGVMYSEMYLYFKGKHCRPRQEMKVRLWKEKDDYRVPDIVVFCDYSRYTGQYYFGSPDLVVEIWSPGNPPDYRATKVEEYRLAGVKELWEVDYTFKRVARSNLNEQGLYDKQYFSFNGKIKSLLFEGLSFNLQELLIDEPDKV